MALAPYTYMANILEYVPDIPPDSIISRTLYTDEQVKVILFTFATGQELSEHTASQAAMLYFAQGEAALTLGEDTMSAQSGTWVHMQPHLPHSIVAKTPLTMLLFMLKTGQT